MEAASSLGSADLGTSHMDPTHTLPYSQRGRGCRRGRGYSPPGKCKAQAFPCTRCLAFCEKRVLVKAGRQGVGPAGQGQGAAGVGWGVGGGGSCWLLTIVVGQQADGAVQAYSRICEMANCLTIDPRPVMHAVPPSHCLNLASSVTWGCFCVLRLPSPLMAYFWECWTWLQLPNCCYRKRQTGVKSWSKLQPCQ